MPAINERRKNLRRSAHFMTLTKLQTLTRKDNVVIIRCVELALDSCGHSHLSAVIGDTEEKQMTFLRRLLEKLKVEPLSPRRSTNRIRRF